MDLDLLRNSVQSPTETKHSSFLTLNLVSPTGSIIEPWGRDWVKRDRQLAEFWHTEPFLASAIASIVMTRSSLTWQLEGPPKSTSAVKKMLEKSDFNRGWASLVNKICLDLLTSDNGAFAEVIREKPRRGVNKWSAPVVGLAHIPSLRCIRTGDPLKPVLYIGKNGSLIELPWYRVITFEELPSTIPNSNNRQICFVSRVLKAAEIIKDVTTYQSEKVSGRFSKALHLVGGVSQAEIERIQRRAELDADNRGLARYLQPIILAALDPNAKVSHEQIDLATLPDAFNFDELMKWYISVIAMAAGGDFQDFAPLPGGDLGTASQSETLHRKSQRKGHALFMKMVESRLQQTNVLPRNVIFRFNQQDAAAELEAAEISQVRANTRSVQISSGEIDVKTARRLAVDAGDLKHSHLINLDGEAKPDQDITLDEDEKEPEIEDEKELSIKVAYQTAKYITNIVSNHPMNDHQSLNEDLLELFTLELRNAIGNEKKITTNDAWQCSEITESAKNAGIAPHLIRLRLPDNLVVYANSKGVYSNYDGWVYKRDIPQNIVKPDIKPAQIATGSRCFKCTNDHVNYNYVITKGWVPVCQRHLNEGLVGNVENPQYTKGELIKAFKEQFNSKPAGKKLGLFASALAYSQELNGGLNPKVIKKAVINVKDTIDILPADVLSQYLL